MPANPSSSANLPCEQCGYLNEPERVYCHNCGAKLDRSLLPKAEEKKKTESPEKARKRIEKITNPKSGGFFFEVKMLFKVLFYAAVVAACIQIAKPPEGVPDPKQASSDRLISGDMADALESPGPRPIAFAENEANDYLKRKLKAKEGVIFGLEFKKAYVNMLPGVLRVNSEYAVFGYSVYPGVHYALDVKDGKFVSTVVGGNLGRLSIDPRLMVYAVAAFDSLWGSLQPERKWMDRMLSVKVGDKRIDFVTKGAQAR